MKKFLICLLAAAVLMVGCASDVITDKVGPVETVLPAHIQRIEDIINKGDGPYLNFVDYRDTPSTVWIWVDNYGIPGKCDFVVVLGVVNKDTDDYVALIGFNESNSPDPCWSGYEAWNDYQIQVDAGRKKLGI